MLHPLEEKLDETIQKEGHYTDGKTGSSAKDSGGETIWGITIATARAFGYRGRMIDMTRDQAKEIYRQRFWYQPRFDMVYALSPMVSMEMFDTGVNMGTGTSSAFLQRALNVLNREAKLFPDMAVDGAVGKMTIYCLKEYLKVRGAKGEVVLKRMLDSQQSVRYMEIAERRPKDEEFQFGWQFNRVG